MSGIGTSELLILLLIVVVLFGSSQLPKLARSLGQARKELEQGAAEAENSDTKTPTE